MPGDTKTGSKALLVSAALAALIAGGALAPAAAQDATWLATPADGNIQNPANWTPGLPGPVGTAFFNTSSITSLINPGLVGIGGITLNPGASDYALLNSGVLDLQGAGIVINGGSLTITNNALLRFLGATAGDTTIITGVGGTTQFLAGASGGNASFSLQGGTVDFSANGAPSTAGLISGFGMIALGSTQLVIGGNNQSTSYFGDITGAGGGIEKVGTGTLRLAGTGSYTGPTVLTSGVLAIGVGALGPGVIQLNGGTLRANVGTGLANTIAVNPGSSGTISAASGHFLTLTGLITIGGNATALRFGEAGSSGSVTVASTGAAIADNTYAIDIVGGTVTATGPAFSILTSNASATNIAAGATLEQRTVGVRGIRNLQSAGNLFIGTGVTLSIGGGLAGGTISGPGFLLLPVPGSFAGSTGLLALTGSATHTGGTTIQAGATLQIGAGGTTGSLAGNVVNDGALVFNRSDAYHFDGVISGNGAVQQVGSGTTDLTAASSYTGATSVTAGTLLVNGSIASSSGLTVAAGATVGGTGVLPNSVINGMLSPGNSIGTITVAGNLTFAGTGVYIVEVGTTTADRTNVTGAAALAGTVRVLPSGQPLVFGTRFTILNAAGGVTGTFSSVQNLIGAAFVPTLSYDANNVFLTLNAGSLSAVGTGLTANQQSVASAIDRAVAAGGDANPFLPLYQLPADGLPPVLDQLSGEVHTAALGLGVRVSGQFLRAMLDPYALGRRRGAGPAPAYAADALAGMPGVIAATQAADAAAVVDSRRFALWATGSGSTTRITGDAATGSARRTERTSGIAAGVDIFLAPEAIVGVALTGSGANASMGAGLGSMSAEVFQAGAYAMTRFAGVELSAALAYSRMEIEASRAVPVLGIAQLDSSYTPQVWSGRLEAAVPIALAGLSIAPSAALQAQSVRTPGFVERSPAGVTPPAALAASPSTAVTIRSELGARVETLIGLPGIDAGVFAHLAWAHYLEQDSSVTVAFVGLPGSTFPVIGARPDRDSALVSAGFEVRLTPQLSFTARFDGEFSEHISDYAGTARVRLEF